MACLQNIDVTIHYVLSSGLSRSKGCFHRWPYNLFPKTLIINPHTSMVVGEFSIWFLTDLYNIQCRSTSVIAGEKRVSFCSALQTFRFLKTITECNWTSHTAICWLLCFTQHNLTYCGTLITNCCFFVLLLVFLRKKDKYTKLCVVSFTYFLSLEIFLWH